MTSAKFKGFLTPSLPHVSTKGVAVPIFTGTNGTLSKDEHSCRVHLGGVVLYASSEVQGPNLSLFVRLAEFLSALWEAEYPVEQGDGDRAGVVGPGGRVGRGALLAQEI